MPFPADGLSEGSRRFGRRPIWLGVVGLLSGRWTAYGAGGLVGAAALIADAADAHRAPELAL